VTRSPVRPFSQSGRVALGLAVVLFVVYSANGPWRGAAGASGDNLPVRDLPFSILRHGSFDLDAMPEAASGHAYFVRRIGGHLVSDYPVGTALLAVPIYASFVLAGLEPRSPLVPWLEKASAAVLVATSAALLYLALCRLAGGIGVLLPHRPAARRAAVGVAASSDRAMGAAAAGPRA
jgi:hypothetical protein